MSRSQQQHSFRASTLLRVAVVTLSSVCLASAQSPAVVARSAQVKQAVDAGRTTRLSGHVPVFANLEKLPSTAMSSGASFARLTIVLNRAPEVEAAFEQLLADQQNPSSPRYHQWLLPAQVGELYGPAQSDVDAVTGWLQSRGLSVSEVSPSRTLITFGGPVSAVASAFSTSFRIFSLANGENRYSLIDEPAVPTALVPAIKTIAGLSQSVHHPTAKRGDFVPAQSSVGYTPALTGTKGGHYLVAGDFAIAYDMNSVYSAGYTGSGQKIAVAGESRVDASDISNLQSLQGQTAKQPNVVIPPTGVDPGTPGDASGKDNGYQDEATLDIDRTLGNAPGAQVDLVVSGDVNGGTTYATDGLFISIRYAIDTLNDPILSVSFGGCEYLNGSSSTLYESSIFQSAAAQGISVFVSAGDDGAAACKAFDDSTHNYDTIRSVNDLCSPYVTCMGGTEFADSTNASLYWSPTSNPTTHTSILSYIPEGAWNDVSVSSSGQYDESGTGGGVSIYLPKPSYQSAAVFTGNYRWMPDMALTSSPHDGFVTCLNYLGANCLTTGFYSFGGTSAAAPSMAAIQAVTNQKLGGRQGNINATLYTLGATPINGVFHDTTIASSGVTNCVITTPSLCNNTTSGTTTLTGGVQGYSVAAGWDPVTGWGSMDVANYVAAVSGSSTGGGGTTSSFTLSPATTSISLSSGATSGNTQSISVVAGSGFSDTVALRCSISATTAYYQPSCSVNPASVTLSSGSTASAMVTINSTAAVTVTQARGVTAGSLAGGGAVLALLLFCVPAGKRRRLQLLAALVLSVGVLGSISGCGSGGNVGSAGPSTVVHSSAGTYTVTVSGTGSATGTTASTTFSVTIN